MSMIERRHSDTFVLGAGVSFVRTRLILSVGDASTKAVDSLLSDDLVLAELSKFFSADGPKRLLFFYQVRSIQSLASESLGEGVEVSIEEEEPELFIPDLEKDHLVGKCIYFLRECSRDVASETVDTDLSSGELSAPLFETMDLVLSELHTPHLKETYDWGRINVDSKESFLMVLGQLREHVQEAVSGIQGGTQLCSLNPDILNDPRAGAWNKMATDDTVMAYIESVLEEWIKQIDTLLKANDLELAGENEDTGPATELSWWRKRMAKLAGVVEQLKGREAKAVFGLANAGKSRLMRKWKSVDGQLTDLLNEAKDNVKYLSSLDHFIEPLYSGTIAQIKDSLPGLFTNLKMMVSIARYYSTADRITRLLRKIANQIIAGCRRCITRKGPAMSQDPGELVENTRVCIGICQDFEEHCEQLKEKLGQLSKGNTKQVEFEPKQVFPNIEKFVGRMTNVVDLINTSMQFSTLYQAEVEGMEGIISRFEGIMQDIRMKPYDFFDYTNDAFDFDFAHLNKQIAELEYSLKAFIDVSFEDMQSTESALALLGKLEAILQRESLKQDLADKYALIFEHYGEELEEVQDQYDRQKLVPPTTRNAPPVAGNIMWARQLLTRVEEPMQRFLSNKAILSGKESRVIVRKYNKVAMTLTTFEAMWYQAWCKSIDSSRAGLNATLIVRHPESPDELVVNFDPEVMQLLRETKALHRLGIELPDSAKMILMQENKFKTNFERMRHHLDEYNRLLQRFSPIMKRLMGPHLEEFERIIRPGMVALTWLSMNIDAYLHKIQTTLHRLNSLTTKVLGVTEFRVERNLKVISRMLLVDLPSDVRFTLDEYVSRQEADVKTKTKKLLDARNEVENALTEIVEVLRTFRTENDETINIPADVVDEFKEHYSHHFYLAILNAVKRSFAAIKRRLGSRQKGGFLFVERPFFDVDVELTIPNVTMHPSLDDVQNAINESAKLVLSSAKSVPILGNDKESYHSLIAKDMQVVQSVLLLTGSVEGSKRQVLEYLETYRRYEFLWTADKNTGYNKFVASNPDLDNFEAELSKYQDIEAEIQAITPVHVVGCMSLRTQSLKYSLKAETAAWKSQYANNLHGKAKKELDGMIQYFQETNDKLSMDVQNVDEVGEMVAHLSQLRSREADLELQIVPVETMYYILAKYDVRIPKDETETLANIRPMWRGLMSLGHEKSGRLTQLQSAFKKELIKTVKGFALECNQFCNEFDMHGPMVAGLASTEAAERLAKFEGLCQEVEAKVRDFHDRETLFGLNKTQYTELSRVRRELDTINLLYSLYSRTEAAIAKFSEFLWVSVAVNMKKMSDTITEFQAELMALPRILRDWVAYRELKQTLHDFQQVLPVLSSISGPAMRTRHWNSIMQTTGKKLNLHADHLRLRHILAIDPVQYRAEIEEVCTAAIKEAELEVKVRELAELWNDMVFTFANYKDRGPVTLDAKSLADIMEKLEESLATLAAITSNRYAKPLEEEVVGWVTKLSGVAEIVEHWNHVQTMWVNVEAVFSLSDISAQLGGEARRYQKVDAAYMKLMGRAAEHPNIIDCCYSDNQLRNLLPHLAGQLELCQKSLAGYLDKKRDAFSRFYFVSDRALLEILSEGISAPAIEHHMAAMFEGLRFLTVAREGMEEVKQALESQGGALGRRDSASSFAGAKDNRSMLGSSSELSSKPWGGSQPEDLAVLGPKLVFAVNSRRGASTEQLKLTTPVEVTDVMESLFGATLAGSIETLRDVFRQSLPPPETPIVYADLVRNFPLQVAVLACQVHWTKGCHDALHRARAEKNIMLHCNKQQGVVLAELLQLAHQELPPSQRLSVETLVSLQIYQREAFDELVQKRAFVPTDFDWVRHARYYWVPGNNGPQDDRLSVCVADMDSNYTWEYMGLKERLVCTALTARCFVAISQAVGLCLGAAIVGPTGMGKTQTVHDLGRGYGRFVATINCTWHMDMKSLEKVFKGLAASGSWGCFDDFARVEPKILSECSQHINCVLTAMRENRTKFTFTDGETIVLDKGCCICATLAPLSDGRPQMTVAGSLRILFRPFSMIHCDTLTILQVRLLSHGFENAPGLAKKLLILYTVCEEQLSHLGHYDFGLRNVTAVLHGLGATKKEEPGLSEQGVLYTTIKRVNLPRLMERDIPTFMSLLGDLLPEAGGASTAPKLIIEEIIRKQVWEDSLDGYPAWIEKMLQFNQVANTHHAVMLTGPCGSGKSAIVGTLCRALTAMDSASKHAVQRMNPKAISMDQMYGWVDAASGEWHDGVFVSLWRSKASKQAVGQHAWIVLDGPIDAVWIETLNSALDESRTLTLANGDKIPMSASMHLVFENDSLAHVSPSAVSRSGVVALDQNTLGWRSLIKSWLETRGEERAVLSSLFDRYMDSLINFTAASCTPALDVSVSAIPRMATALYESVSREVRPENLSGVFLEKVFIFCVAWGIGGRLDNGDRVKFSAFLRTITELLPPTSDSESLFDFFPDDKTADWQPWSSCVGPWEFPPLFGETIFHDLQLPTPDSWRTEFMIRMFASSGTCVLVTGPPGCGKSTSVRRYAKGLDPDNHTSSSMCLSGTTLPRSMIAGIEDVVEKRQGRTYAPTGGKKCTFLIEDIAQPHVDTFGDQACLEFLRQLLADGGYYATHSTEFNTIQGMQFICEMIQPSVSGKDLPLRLKGRMLSFQCSMPRDSVVTSIFSRMLHGKFKRYQAPRTLVDLVIPLCDITVEMWHRCATKYPPTPSHPHLQFTLHDVARVFQGMLRPAVSTMPDAEYLISLWKWELQRSFMDKLTTPDDLWNCWDGVTYSMKERIHLHLPSYCYEMMGTAPAKRTDPLANGSRNASFKTTIVEQSDSSSGPKLFFSDAVKGDAKPGYRLIDLQEVMELAEEARKNTSLGSVVLFDDAISHVMRIARVLGSQRGCMLIVGDGGAGRRPLSRMAAVLAGSRYLEWQSTDAQSRARTMDLVKDAYRLAGVRGVSVTLALDNERTDPQTLEMLNQFVSTGEFPGLLTKDDLDMVLEEMRSAASLTESGPSNPTLGGKPGNDAYARFVTRARSCFHVILTFSPGEKLNECMRGYAGITRRCTVDWFMPWGRETASNVAITLMKNKNDFSTIEPVRLADCMAATHCLVQDFLPTHLRMTQRQVYVTPGTFLSFADTYQMVYLKHANEIRQRMHMMSAGLKKLHGARTGASEMQEDLQQKDSVLAQAQVSAGELLKEITDSTMKAEKKKGEVTIVKNQLSEQATLIQQDRDDCERDLETAKPSLIAAETALQSINQKDLMALKTMKNPPAIVRMILDAMLILLHKQIRPVEVVEGGAYRDSFEFANQAMNDPAFVDSLMNFPKEALTAEDVELLAPYLTHKDFQPDKVRAQSAMAANLCSWVRAICQYQEIARLVFPKQEKLVMAEAQLAIAHRQLQKAVDELAKCQEDLDVMQARFEVAMGEKQRLSDDSRNTMSKIDTANRLILALGGENDRWVKQVRECEEELIRLPGDSIVAASFMDYLGPFSQEYRAEILKGIAAKCNELRIHVSTSPDIHRFFTTNAEIRKWIAFGLPPDDVSLQNATLTMHSSRWPIIIDPQDQAVAWIKRLGGDTISFADINAMVDGLRTGEKTLLEDCLVSGRQIVMTNVTEEIDPILDNLIAKTLTSTGKRFTVHLGGRDVEFTPGFRLVLSTHLPNPQISPFVASQTSLVDFTVSLKGLEHQLLNLVVSIDKSKVHKQKVQVDAVVDQHRNVIEELNNSLLVRLSGEEGNLLDDEALMSALSNTKSSLDTEINALKEASESQELANRQCEEYRPVALRGALLFFAAEQMNKLRSMYYVSLSYYIGLFSEAVANTEQLLSRQSRIPSVTASITRAVMDFCRRVYFHTHRDVFRLIVSLKVLQHEKGTVTSDHLYCLSKGGMHVLLSQCPRKPKDWMTDTTYANLIALSERVPKLHNVIDTFCRKEPWRHWIEKDKPEEENCPDADLPMILRLLIIRAMREDRVVPAARILVTQTLGEEHTGHADLDEVLAASTSITPIICISELGNDATSSVLSISRRKHKRVTQIALGQDRVGDLWRVVHGEMEVGGWIVLQNAHLAVPAVNALEKKLVEASSAEAGITRHASFRLWITTQEAKDMSPGLLLMSMRVSCEAPEGIRAGMQQLYSEMVDQDLIDSMDASRDWSRLIYTMSYLHCVIRQRLLYSVMGWNVDESVIGLQVTDWQVCISYLRDHMLDKGAREIKRSMWLGIRYMTSEIQFGGGLLDEWDERIMMVYTDRFFAEDAMVHPNEWFAGVQRPDSAQIGDHLETIKAIKKDDTPDMVGLGPAAENVRQTQSGRLVIEALCALETRSISSNRHFPPETLADEAAGVAVGKLPRGWSPDFINNQANKHGSTNPVVLFMRQEAEMMNRVVAYTKSTLRDLRGALGGGSVVTPAMTTMVAELSRARVPSVLAKMSFPAPTLASWLSGLQQRYDTLDKWMGSNARPKSFWLGGFFQPQGFLMALKQDACRRHAGWNLEDLKINSEVFVKDSDAHKPGDDSVMITGLSLEGAAWQPKTDRGGEGKLTNSPAKVLFNEFPKLQIMLLPGTKANLAEGRTPMGEPRPSDLRRLEGPYICPVYTNPQRGKHNFVMTVSLKTDDSPHKWILRGTALICARDGLI